MIMLGHYKYGGHIGQSFLNYYTRKYSNIYLSKPKLNKIFCVHIHHMNHLMVPSRYTTFMSLEKLSDKEIPLPSFSHVWQLITHLLLD